MITLKVREKNFVLNFEMFKRNTSSKVLIDVNSLGYISPSRSGLNEESEPKNY